MAANASNRETSRDYLADLLNTALVGVGLPAQMVSGYEIGDLSGNAPAVMVLSAGTRRKQSASGTSTYHSWHRLQIMSLVQTADGTGSWTEAMVEDRLDLIEKTICDVIADNRGRKQNPTVPWIYLETDEDAFGDIEPVTIGGKTYRLERFFVIAEVMD